MSNERVAIPELLFSPSDIGIEQVMMLLPPTMPLPSPLSHLVLQCHLILSFALLYGIAQAGVAECVVQAVEACIPDVREALYANVLITGGSSKFQNFEVVLRFLCPGPFFHLFLAPVVCAEEIALTPAPCRTCVGASTP